MNESKTTNVMTSEKNKTVIFKDGHKCRFHKMSKNDVERRTCFKNSRKSCFKTDSNGVTTEIVNDHNHDEPSEQNIIRQK